MKIIDIIRIIDIIAFNFIRLPPAHSSGIWLQILGFTAGMHSYASEAAIKAKILRNPGGRCTSVLAGTRMKQAFSTSLTPAATRAGRYRAAYLAECLYCLYTAERTN